MALNGSDRWDNPNSDPMQDVLDWKELHMRKRIQRYKLQCGFCGKVYPSVHLTMETRREAESELLYLHTTDKDTVFPPKCICNQVGSIKIVAINALDRVIETMEVHSGKTKYFDMGRGRGDSILDILNAGGLNASGPLPRAVILDPSTQKYEMLCARCKYHISPWVTNMETRRDAVKELDNYKRGKGRRMDGMCPKCGQDGSIVIRALNALDRVIETMEVCNVDE